MLSLSAPLLGPRWPCRRWPTLVPQHWHTAQVPPPGAGSRFPFPQHENVCFLSGSSLQLYQRVFSACCGNRVPSSVHAPRIFRYPEKGWNRTNSQISLLVMKSFHTLPWPPCSLFFYFFIWKASSFLPNLSVTCQLSQSRILTAEIVAALKSLPFIPRLARSDFLMLLSLGNATISRSSRPVPSFSGRSANNALPREVRVGISCCTGSSSYFWSSFALPGAPVLGVAAIFWGILIL